MTIVAIDLPLKSSEAHFVCTLLKFMTRGTQILTRHGRALAAAAMTVLLCGSALAAETSVRFNRDVRPILADNCFACHGPDANKRKAGLRLDVKEGLFEKTPKR